MGSEMCIRDRSGLVDQGVGKGDIVAVSGADEQHARTALLVHQPVDFGGSAASGGPYALEKGPPFAPPAERWAFTDVESIAALE